jgi:site-specific recombinase XerD
MPVINEGDSIRFGFHTLRHSLASYLVQQGKDPKTVQTLLRHADVATTVGIYTLTGGRNESWPP